MVSKRAAANQIQEHGGADDQTSKFCSLGLVNFVFIN